MNWLNDFLVPITSYSIFILLLICTVNYFNFGFRRPLLFNLVLASAVTISLFISIYSFIIIPNLNKGVPPPIILLLFLCPYFITLIFNRHKYGYILLVIAFGIALFTINSLYKVVDSEKYSFENNYVRLYKPFCAAKITSILEILEKAKKEVSKDHPIINKSFDYMLFNESSEIFLYLKENYKFNLSYDLKRKLTLKLPFSKWLGIYKIRYEDHHFYTTKGKFNDIIIYCDEVSESEVKDALNKVKLEIQKNEEK